MEHCSEHNNTPSLDSLRLAPPSLGTTQSHKPYRAQQAYPPLPSQKLKRDVQEQRSDARLSPAKYIFGWRGKQGNGQIPRSSTHSTEKQS